MEFQLNGKRIERFAQISRVDEEQRLVYGIATDETPVREWPGVDIEVVVSHGATKKAVGRWLQWGNIREMHQPSAVGVAREVSFNDATRETFVTAYVADDQAWEKVKAGVYKGFSILGPIHAWDQPDKKMKRIFVTDYDLDEISLCDRPKNPTNVIKLWQAVGTETNEEVSDMPGQLQRAAPFWIAGGDPYMRTADDGVVWDETTAIADWLDHSTEGDRVNYAEYGRMFLLRDAANPEAPESYQLPFAAEVQVSYYEGDMHDELACIPDGLFAAVTAMQAMTDLNEATKRDVERRIEMYYHAMNRRAPWEIQQSKTGGQDMSNALWKQLMGEDAMPEDPAKAVELIRAKLTPALIKIDAVPLEPSPEIKRALDGITSIEAKFAAMDERMKRIEAMPVMPTVQRTGEPELSIEEKIAKLERTIKTQQLHSDAPEVIELQRLYQQKRSAKK